MIIELFDERSRDWAANLPDRVEAVVCDAERQVAEHAGSNDAAVPVLGLVNGNARLVAQALRLIRERSLAPGLRFVEWGSGLGGGTCVASALGFDALGIDVVPEWVERGRRLAAQHGLSARFSCESYCPDWVLRVIDGQDATRQAVDWLDADIVYVYPWPAEVRLVERIFLELAHDDALLLSTYGPAEVRIHRKADLDGRGGYATRRPDVGEEVTGQLRKSPEPELRPPPKELINDEAGYRDLRKRVD